jgi:hypothetical protein
MVIGQKTTQKRQVILTPFDDESGGAKLDHGSGGIVPLRAA